MKYSFIIPVFNRPDEVDELLDSLTRQRVSDFEVIIVEDGSQTPCQEVCRKYDGRLNLKYFMKENSGPGQSRNYGVERAQGEYVIILDSDVVVPEDYLAEVDAELQSDPCDAFGGPDRAHPSFTRTQKAISYSMTSFFTTGGIRGGKKKLDKFIHARSIWEVRRRGIYPVWAGSLRCASAKTSTSPSVSSRPGASAASFPQRGSTTSAAPTSASFGGRSTTAE
jgi:glycosyltransferase involved in cell wall biosynthesis